MNALAHGAESLYTPPANPVAEMAAPRRRVDRRRARPASRGARSRRLAPGATLCGYAVDSTGFAVQHVLCQTVVRVCGTPHAETYAAVLPRVMDDARSGPGRDRVARRRARHRPARIGERIDRLAGGPVRLGELGADRELHGKVVEVAMQRPELGSDPAPAVLGRARRFSPPPGDEFRGRFCPARSGKRMGGER